ncbi:MAG: tRNA uridine-5-carboxymethylaminomethyl(34) synthesis GTPase MnmE [Acidobacteria bacterium]|nr:tRNA modification GTPase MnmE [Pyrinomonadaceae bacterium]RIJ92017.1 MAG: tRNA uridine-5-carboxymethylaminomethyl(34) synthesis GTPase MnmE [Acidobacteriota bacterium]
MDVSANTIVALATPAGRSGIGIIRLSGDGALDVAAKLTGRDCDAFSPRKAALAELRDPTDNAAIDKALITYFQAPHSFTGEDVIEISCHGSPVLLRQVIDLCLALGCRAAEPGEFTLRALAHGRLDLAEAEAIRDLIDAQTNAAARQAVRQLSGEMSRNLRPLKDELLNIVVVLESALEFVEDDLPEQQSEEIVSSLEAIKRRTLEFADTYKAGHLIRDGLSATIVGRPNVGKSSLFNRLLGTERAIVTDLAGTTRDQLNERFTIGDIPTHLVDTAGLRETEDVVEKIGVERARGAMADADLVIVVLDAHDSLTEEDRDIVRSALKQNFIIALNKIDKTTSRDIDRLAAAGDAALAPFREKMVAISAKTGEGLDDLRDAIVKPFRTNDVSHSGFLVTDARHYDLLMRTHDEIAQSIEGLREGRSEEIVLIGLHNALRYLGEITGETTTEDMLTRIFSTFCIGK